MVAAIAKLSSHQHIPGEEGYKSIDNGLEKKSMDANIDKVRSSDRYDSVDWWRLDVHDLGFESRLIRTPAIVTPLLRWLSTTQTRLTSLRRLSCKRIENTSKNGMNAI